METDRTLEQIEQAAATWLLRKESAEWSTADEAALEDWLKASASHRVAYIRLKSVWREAGRLKAVSASFPAGRVPARGEITATPFFALKRRPAAATIAAVPSDAIESHQGQSNASRGSRLGKLRYGIAASILFFAIGAGVYFIGNDDPFYRTPIGGLATIPMQDGSKITLNTDTAMTVQITEQERRVNLVQGEAFFDVAKDPNKPFVVYANDRRVIAVGTKFSVRVAPTGVKVVVTEGLVRLEEGASLLKPFHRSAADKSATGGAPLLAPGAVADVKNRQVVIRQQSPEDVEQALSWRTGYVVLRKATLTEAVAEFNRYNHRQLVIDDPALSDIKVGGNFRTDNLDGFVRLLEQGFNVEADERGERIVLTSRVDLP